MSLFHVYTDSYNPKPCCSYLTAPNDDNDDVDDDDDNNVVSILLLMMMMMMMKSKIRKTEKRN
jgi:hypothetical protein